MTVARASCICERCGKEFEVATKRPNRRDADNFERWAEENIVICPECRDRVRAETYRHEAEAAKIKADECGLPELKGSERQVQWALSIREKRMDEIQQIICQAEKLVSSNDEKQILSDFKTRAKELFREENAKYWIESRYLDAGNVVQNHHREMIRKKI
mgnify:CR=1 FL=1